MVVKPMVRGDSLEKTQLSIGQKQNLGIFTFYKVRLFKIKSTQYTLNV